MSEYFYNIIVGTPKEFKLIAYKTRFKSSRKHSVFPSYSALTNSLEQRNEVTRFPCTCNFSVLVSSFHISLTNTLLENNNFVFSNTCTL